VTRFRRGLADLDEVEAERLDLGMVAGIGAG
jgi:hypothetical protein